MRVSERLAAREKGVYRYTLTRWEYEYRDVTIGSVVMCHDHRQMFIEPAYGVAAAVATDEPCPICRYQEAIDGRAERPEELELWEMVR